jgi:hypothetical protein
MESTRLYCMNAERELLQICRFASIVSCFLMLITLINRFFWKFEHAMNDPMAYEYWYCALF